MDGTRLPVVYGPEAVACHASCHGLAMDVRQSSHLTDESTVYTLFIMLKSSFILGREILNFSIAEV